MFNLTKYRYKLSDWLYVKFILPIIIKDKIEFIIDMLKLVISENSCAASIHLRRGIDELNEYLKYYPESKNIIIHELEKSNKEEIKQIIDKLITNLKQTNKLALDLNTISNQN